MHLTIREYEVEPQAVGEIMRRVSEGFAPIISQAPGFVAFYAVDFGGGRIASLSIFADEASANESTRIAAEHIRTHLAAFFPNPPKVLSGEVRAYRSAPRDDAQS
ncbi:MAG: hypothetical protein LC737_09930, partial [Chloroflexi bacterium]|nr:hypothetical protein [Chloroflexota bacterium]